jgi:cell division protein FtsI (penicillin-binding protein 3)
MNIRSIIISRLAIVYFLMLVFAIVVVVNLLAVQNIKNEKWENIAKNLKNNTVVIEANRGNICDDDGNVLATSVPGYFIRMDMAAQGVKRVYTAESDSLAIYLSRYFRDRSAAEYKRIMDVAYRNGNRGLMLTPRKIDYNELQDLKKFPILRRGAFGGGRIIEQENKRVLPLGKLASRTIGTLNKGVYGGIHGNIGYTGIEGAFETYLKGKEGVGYRQNLSGRWVNRIEIEPSDGMDVITTIDVRYQDITESALERQLNASNAEWGTAILMDVKTGDIKAIANLGRVSPGRYDEIYNYALGHAGNYEPGSTFKLISMMVALDHGVVDTSDVIDTGNGTWQYRGRTVYDSDYRYGGHGPISVKQIFEKSSNVGFAKMITANYEKNPREFIDRINNMGINKPLNLELKGEGIPYFKYPGDKDWWGTTLAWMSYGYESKMTPLQILTVYNAVANDGRMVKPRFIKEIQDRGEVIKRMKTEVLNPMIVSRETIRKAQSLLEGVCENGTGKSIQSKMFKIAGKTGTAQISTGQGGYDKGLYLASFAGYFPADKPAYSMIVVVNKPQGSYYGGVVAGPVFKEVAEKVFALYTNYEDLPEEETLFASVPEVKNGLSRDLLKVLNSLDVDTNGKKPSSLVARAIKGEDAITFEEMDISGEKIPDVRGMAPSDAVYLLENAGLHVRITGVGKVRSQSMSPGSLYKQGQSITLILG